MFTGEKYINKLKGFEIENMSKDSVYYKNLKSDLENKKQLYLFSKNL